MQEILIRDLDPKDDLGFVIDSWLRSYYGHSPSCEWIPKHLFLKKHREIIQKLLAKSLVKLAVKSDDPNIIVGYIVFEREKNTLHYVYIKENFRGFGICRRLIMENNCFDGMLITHLTLRGRKIQLRMGYTYHPYFE